MFEEAVPVLDGGDHGAGVDVVEEVVEDPVLIAVVDEECAVWRDAVCVSIFRFMGFGVWTDEVGWIGLSDVSCSSLTVGIEEVP